MKYYPAIPYFPGAWPCYYTPMLFCSPLPAYTGCSAPPAYSTAPPPLHVPLPTHIDQPPPQAPKQPRSSKWPSFFVHPVDSYCDPMDPYAEAIPDASDDEGSECTTPSPPPFPTYHIQPVNAPKKRRNAKLEADWDAYDHRKRLREADTRRRRSSLRSHPGDMHFDALHPGPRPSNWRHDYLPPHSAKSSRFFRGRERHPHTISKFVSTKTAKYALNPLLKFSPNKFPINFDLRLDPQSYNVQFLNVPRFTNWIDFYQVATDPSVHELVLYHPKLPWDIIVRATQSNGITVGDIFDQIYANLSTRVSSQDYYNTSMNATDREEILTAYQYRTALGSHTDKGLLRMDFLGFDVVFLGLAKGRNGLLEIKTSVASS